MAVEPQAVQGRARASSDELKYLKFPSSLANMNIHTFLFNFLFLETLQFYLWTWKFKFPNQFWKGKFSVEHIWECSFEKKTCHLLFSSPTLSRPLLLQTVSLNKLLRRTERQIVSQGAKNVENCQEKKSFSCCSTINNNYWPVCGNIMMNLKHPHKGKYHHHIFWSMITVCCHF